MGGASAGFGSASGSGAVVAVTSVVFERSATIPSFTLSGFVVSGATAIGQPIMANNAKANGSLRRSMRALLGFRVVPLETGHKRARSIPDLVSRDAALDPRGDRVRSCDAARRRRCRDARPHRAP